MGEELKHTTIEIDDRCIDLLMTDEEIAVAFDRSLRQENRAFIDEKKCCSCWSVNPPPHCPFWRRILGICKNCEK